MVSLGRNIFGGIVGGIVGVTIMTVILIGSKMMMGMPAFADFFVMGTFVGGNTGSAIGAGFVAHYLVGIADGAIFATIVTSVSRFRLTSWGKAVGLGLIFGFILWLIVFIPVTMGGFAPIMMSMMGPAAAKMLPMVLGISLMEHLLYGISVGGVMFAILRRLHRAVTYRCEACGDSFGSQEDLMKHKKEHMKA